MPVSGSTGSEGGRLRRKLQPQRGRRVRPPADPCGRANLARRVDPARLSRCAPPWRGLVAAILALRAGARPDGPEAPYAAEAAPRAAVAAVLGNVSSLALGAVWPPALLVSGAYLSVCVGASPGRSGRAEERLRPVGRPCDGGDASRLGRGVSLPGHPERVAVTAPARRLDVLLCTFRRPEVRETLRSLDAQALPEAIALRIVVPDNDDGPTARSLVERDGRRDAPSRCSTATRRPATSRWPAMPGSTPRASAAPIGSPSSTMTRPPQPDWLAELLRHAGETGADAVFGPSLRGVWPRGSALDAPPGPPFQPPGSPRRRGRDRPYLQRAPRWARRPLAGASASTSRAGARAARTPSSSSVSFASARGSRSARPRSCARACPPAGFRSGGSCGASTDRAAATRRRREEPQVAARWRSPQRQRRWRARAGRWPEPGPRTGATSGFCAAPCTSASSRGAWS